MSDDVLQVSPSQVDSYLGCPRRWWLKSVVRMPTVEGQEQYVVGNVVHAICERFMLADDNGRVPAPPSGGTWLQGPLEGQRVGAPVELYPEGWDLPLRSPALAGHVRKVVREAIETGVLVRHPGRRVESGYKREVIPGVRMSGRMDVEHSGGVDDHKTTASRRWCSSAEDLADDPKMLCYGHEWLMRWRSTWGDGCDPDFVTLRLNYLSKDPDDPFTKHVEVDVGSEVVEGWWEETVIPTAREMLASARSGLTEKDWSKVEGPRARGECRKYGGCDFAPICSRARAPAAHRRIVDRINGAAVAPDRRPKRSSTATNGEKQMSLFSKARKRKDGVPATSVVEAPAPTEAAETGGVAVVEVDPKSVSGRAPWANPGCRACAGSGVSSRNSVCEACDTIASRKRLPTSAAFQVWNDKETGDLCWAAEDASSGGSATRAAKPAENATPAKVVRARRVKEPEPEPEAEESEVEEAEEAEPDAEAEEVEVEVEAEETEVEPEPKPKPRPTRVTSRPAPSAPKAKAKAKEDQDSREARSEVERPEVVPGLVLLVNAVYLRAPKGETVDLHDILAREGADLAQSIRDDLGKDVDSFYQLNPWDRKDMLGRCVGEIARELENTTVVAVGSSQDFRQMVDLLRPYAEVVVGGML